MLGIIACELGRKYTLFYFKKHGQNPVGLTVIPSVGTRWEKFFIISFGFLLSSPSLGPPERNCSQPVH